MGFGDWLGGAFHSVASAGNAAFNRVHNSAASITHGVAEYTGHGITTVASGVTHAVDAVRQTAVSVETGVTHAVDAGRQAAVTLAQNAATGAITATHAIGRGAQAAKDVVDNIAGSSFVQGLEKNWVDNSNLPGLLGSAEAPLVSGIGGFGLAVALGVGFLLLTKA